MNEVRCKTGKDRKARQDQDGGKRRGDSFKRRGGWGFNPITDHEQGGMSRS